MAATPEGDAVYVGKVGGRIDVLNPLQGASAFLGAAPSTLLCLIVAGNFLYTIDDTGAWESHATFSRGSGERVFSYDWRNHSRGAFYAPLSKKIFTFRDGTSPNDIYYEVIDSVTGALGEDIESPYHGDYSLGHPIRVSPDETTVYVASGVAFNAADLTYKTSIGIPYTDLAFAGDRLYLLHSNASGTGSEVVALDARFAVIESYAHVGTPLRVFVHENRLTTFTRKDGTILTSNVGLE